MIEKLAERIFGKEKEKKKEKVKYVWNRLKGCEDDKDAFRRRPC